MTHTPKPPKTIARETLLSVNDCKELILQESLESALTKVITTERAEADKLRQEIDNWVAQAKSIAIECSNKIDDVRELRQQLAEKDKIIQRFPYVITPSVKDLQSKLSLAISGLEKLVSPIGMWWHPEQEESRQLVIELLTKLKGDKKSYQGDKMKQNEEITLDKVRGILEQQFPNGECKERGGAIVLFAYFKVFVDAKDSYIQELEKRVEELEAEQSRLHKSIIDICIIGTKEKTFLSVPEMSVSILQSRIEEITAWGKKAQLRLFQLGELDLVEEANTYTKSKER